VWIDGKDLVPGVFQPVIDQVADGMMAVVTRHTRNRDPFLREKVVDSCLKG
jgi:hypothetical protein